MWDFLSARLRSCLLLAIALPLARLLVHRLAIVAERHDPSARRAKALRRADSAVTALPGRSMRRAGLKPARNRQMAESSSATPLWRGPSPLRCLVTGASGYIGGRLVPELLVAAYPVRCMAATRESSATGPGRAT
jgi:hypothetical protein